MVLLAAIENERHWILSGIFVLLVLLFWKKHFNTSRAISQAPPIVRSHRQLFDDPEMCKAILACNYRASGRELSLAMMLKARSPSNTRLRTAFGIDNAFTTTDVSWYHSFRKTSGSYLRLSTEEWKTLANKASQIVIKGTSLDAEFVALASLVQLLTLKTALYIFFNRDVSDLDDRQVSYIVSGINRIWIASKHADQIQPWRHQKGMIQALRHIIPDHDPLSPRDNPMNLILPSYETMWRVVLRCVIEVHFRSHTSATKWQQVLRDFLRDPTSDVFKRVTDPEVSPAAIAKEALRLYPPTRRINRDLPSPSGASLSTSAILLPPSHSCVAADIEALHRSSTEWRGSGDSHANNFWPQRWVGPGRAEGLFLAFGGSQFECPAWRSNFGSMMVALLVSALSDALQGNWQIEDAYADEMMECIPLKSERNAYDGLRLVQISA